VHSSVYDVGAVGVNVSLYGYDGVAVVVCVSYIAVVGVDGVRDSEAMVALQTPT